MKHGRVRVVVVLIDGMVVVPKQYSSRALEFKALGFDSMRYGGIQFQGLIFDARPSIRALVIRRWSRRVYDGFTERWLNF